VHGLEQQPCGVQVVEWVGLVASGFQFIVMDGNSRRSSNSNASEKS